MYHAGIQCVYIIALAVLSHTVSAVAPFCCHTCQMVWLKCLMNLNLPHPLNPHRKLTKQDCGKLWMPCGGVAKKLGCQEKQHLLCGAGAFCASPGDTRLGGPRCLPLPSKCGTFDNPCCPANKGGVTPELWIMDNKTPVPYCSDGKSFCVWNFNDFDKQGVANFPNNDPSNPNYRFAWDGYYQRGYGRSRCAPLPKGGKCGAPGQHCCPSMHDRMMSGMVHNKNFTYQPCNYRAAGRVGVYCKGAWQGNLLNKGKPLGVCTLNAKDCGQIGKLCCLNDVPEVGVVGTCQTSAPPGQYYCTADTQMCTACPQAPKTAYEKRSCFAWGQPTYEAGTDLLRG